jgi:hypothetical protein
MRVCKEGGKMKSRKVPIIAVSAFAVGVIGASVAGAADVIVQPGQAPVVVQPAQPSVTGQPSGPTVVVPQQQAPATVVVPSAPSTVQANDIVARDVRAQTIYANKIKAPIVQGTIHQSDSVKIKDTKGDIKLPSVNAGVIYADTIKANSVVAENIYVRDIERD